MSHLRNATDLSRFAQRIPLSVRQSLNGSRRFSSIPARFAQDYGDGKGDPKGENPQEQAKASKATSDLERKPFQLLVG
jgi:hypothetical protein